MRKIRKFSEWWNKPFRRSLSCYEDKELVKNLRKNYAFFGNLFSRLDLSRNISFESLFGYELLYQNNLSCNREKHIKLPKAYNPILENEYQVLDLAYHWHNRLHFSETLAEEHHVEASLGFELGQNENQWIPVEQIIYSPASYQNLEPLQKPKLLPMRGLSGLQAPGSCRYFELYF